MKNSSLFGKHLCKNLLFCHFWQFRMRMKLKLWVATLRFDQYELLGYCLCKMSSRESSLSLTPSGTPLSSGQMPKYGTLIPNRVFVGGIASDVSLTNNI